MNIFLIDETGRSVDGERLVRAAVNAIKATGRVLKSGVEFVVTDGFTHAVMAMDTIIMVSNVHSDRIGDQWFSVAAVGELSPTGERLKKEFLDYCSVEA